MGLAWAWHGTGVGMAVEPAGSRAVELLISQAWQAADEGRYQRAASAGNRAVQAAEALGDPALLARALDIEAEALRMLGDSSAALARYTRVLALAEDPSTRHRLDGPDAARALARAYSHWVACARFMTGIPHRKLFAVLDAAEAWLAATGHRAWRAAVLLERAGLHDRLGETAAAVAAAEEALAAYHPDAPGHSRAAYRFQLGDILRGAGRHAEAAPHYQAILDDPTGNAYDRKVAHQGLAYCALAAGDPGTARRHATTAATLAEALGDDALCPALDALAEACRAGGDLDAAWQAATRHLDAARRIGGHLRPYYAVRTAADVALDRADLTAARTLLADLDRHATAMDTASSTTTYTTEAAERHQRLAEAEAEAEAEAHAKAEPGRTSRPASG